MIEKNMVLKVDLQQFLDDEGNELELTDQAKTVFQFLTKIVSSVSETMMNYFVQGILTQHLLLLMSLIGIATHVKRRERYRIGEAVCGTSKNLQSIRSFNAITIQCHSAIKSK
jgi:uncharacterized membrane protein